MMVHWGKFLIACLLLALLSGIGTVLAQDEPPTVPEVAPGEFASLADQGAQQTSELFYDEAMTVYLGNLERRNLDIPPLRWNRELTLGARWFAWDSTENRPGGYCGHQDTLGTWPSDRAVRFGYLGGAGAENAFCGYVTPADAILGWMNSPGHRANLLDPGSREIGLGYYRRSSDGRGYVAQAFGNDAVYPPMIIENERPYTTNSSVGLYLYSPSGSGSITDMGSATQMRISDNACLTGAGWQAFQNEPTWTLPGGQGWKTVYAQIRDRLGRTSTASDTIYSGSTLPADELSFAQLTETRSTVTLYDLNGDGMPYAQFSPGWVADNSDGTFSLLWGRGTLVNDAAALGGTAFRLDTSPDYESTAWVWTFSFVPNTPLVAYFRLKVSSNSSNNWAARITVEANEVATSREIKGSDFKTANQYQEFAVPFTYQKDPDKPFLIFKISRNNSPANPASVTFDAVTIFTASRGFDPLRTTWTLPDKHYRGQGIWVRFSDGNGNFTDWQEAATHALLSPSITQVHLLAEDGQTSRPLGFQVLRDCQAADWTVASSPGWLQYSKDGDHLEVWSSPTSLGAYKGSLILQSSNPSYSVAVPVNLLVVDKISSQYLPLTVR
jgi:uncharacterized protein YkwD